MNNQLYIRISKNSLCFAVADPKAENGVRYEPYVMKSGMSMAANLREAFREAVLPAQGYQRAQLLVDMPWMLVPIQEFDAKECDVLYQHTFSDSAVAVDQRVVMHNVLSDLNVAVLYAVNRDLKTVVEDHFEDVSYRHVMSFAWSHMLSRSFTGRFRKLYAYEHEGRLDVFSFDRNRFHFANVFDVTHYEDAPFYLMAVWQQLAMDNEDDELHLTFETADATTADEQQARNSILEAQRRHLRKVYLTNPAVELNHARVTQVKGMPFDLMVSLAG